MTKSTATLLLLLLLLVAHSPRALLQNATCVCAGIAHSCLISGVGDVVCWGNAVAGRLGYGSTTDYHSPSAALAVNPGGVQVTPNNTVAVLKIACGYQFTMALLANGDAIGWGRNLNGQLGLGHVQNVGDIGLPWQSFGGPVTLVGPARDVCSGALHCCTVLNLGKAACWGKAFDGQLGYGNTVTIGDNETVASAGFVDVGGTGNVTTIFCGSSHTLALMSDGALRGWGANGYGQLGLNHTTVIGDNEHPSSQPNIALGLGGGITAEWVSAGQYHSCVVSSAGEGKCFGFGTFGCLGTGNTNDVNDPSSIGVLDFGPGELVVQLEAFERHSCAVLATGDVKCFGASSLGRLGCGYRCPDHLAPDESVVLSGAVSRLSTGCFARHTFAAHPDGSFQAWGYGFNGQLGYGNNETVGDDETSASVGNVNFPDGVTCAVPLPDTLTELSDTVTEASKTRTEPNDTATQPSATLATHSQTGITRTPRSHPNTLTATHTRHASSAAEPVPAASSSPSSPSDAGGGVVGVTVVLVGVGAVVLLVGLGLAALGVFLLLRRRRGHADEKEVEMSPSSSSSSAQRSGLEYANASSVVPGSDGLEYANVGGVADAASEYANAPIH